MTTLTFDPYDFSKREIGSVPVYYKNLPWAPCIHIRVVFNVGAFNDPIGKEGLSHYLEHLLLKGCPSIPDKKASRAWSKENALNSLGAYTNHNNTCYELKCMPEKYDVVLDGLKDMIFNSFLKPEDIEDERKVIIQEAWGRFLNEKFLKYIKEFAQIVFHGTQLARQQRALGWPDTIEKITVPDIVDWYKKNYGIGNFYILVVGAIEESHIEKLKEFTKDLPKVERADYDFGIINKPTQNKVVKKSEEIGEVKEQVEISLSRIFEKTLPENTEVIAVLNRLLSDILNEKLRTELSLCYGVSSRISVSKKYTSVYVGIKTEEKNIELVEKEFGFVLDALIKGDYQERFDIIKKMYKEQIKAQEFLSGDITDGAIEDVSKFDGYIISEADRLQYLEKVKHEDVIKIAKVAFDPEYLVTEIILPSKK